MSFTDLQTVRKHLISSVTPEQEITGLPITLNEQTDYLLPHTNLVDSSETLKWKTQVHPAQDGPITLTLEKDVNINTATLVPNTIVVSTDEDLSIIYVEEKDYIINYKDGTIRRVASGDIPTPQQVYVYFEAFEVFLDTIDYTINYQHGVVVRTVSGDIPDGATILIDYSVQEGSVEDSMIELAITEAEDIIVRGLSSEYSASSTDQGIETGATQLALSIVARALAAESLISNRSSDAPNRSREWRSLAEQWEAQAWCTLGPFLDPNQLHSPVAE